VLLPTLVRGPFAFPIYDFPLGGYVDWRCSGGLVVSFAGAVERTAELFAPLRRTFEDAEGF